MELRQYLSVVWKWVWLIALSTIIAGGASYVATYNQPKLFQASTTLLVGQSIQSDNPNPVDIGTSERLAQTYIQIVKTSPVLQGTIDALGLPMTVDQLRGEVSASSVGGTQLFLLKVVDTDPARAQAIANEEAHQLTLQGPAANEAARAQARDFVRQQLDDLQKKIEDANKSIVEVNAALQSASSARDIADKQSQLTTLQNQVGDWQKNYSALIQVLDPRSPNFISIIEPAEQPTAPFSPNLPLNVGLAAAVGFVLAIAAAFLLEYLDDTLKQPEDVSRVLELTTIGEIGQITGANEEKLVAVMAPRSSISEAYRVLRTNIHFSDVDRQLKFILVTSASPMEGKSLTAANLAIVMAQAGLRTVLLDCDLRKPSLHRLFNLSNDIGLTNSLLSNANLDGFIRPTRIENLRVLTSGALPPNPAELLSSVRMHTLKERLEPIADVVIIDSPPCGLIADAAILARMSDGVLLVVDSARTRREPALRAKQVIMNAGGRIIGAVMNRLTPRHAGYAYYYRSYYSQDQAGARARASARVQRPSVISRWIHAFTRR